MGIDDWNQLRSVALYLGIDKGGRELIYFINQSNTPARFKMPSSDLDGWEVVCDTSISEVGCGKVSRDILLSASSMMILTRD
jgi:glycogen operon protein